MKLQEILQLIGLSDKEATVYLSLLELGEGSVAQISRKSGIERTYCYDLLDSLVSKGKATVVTSNSKQRYQAVSPDNLQMDAEETLSHIKKAMPELVAHYNTSGQKPRVYYFEGREAIERLYREMINSLQYDAIVSPGALYEALGEKKIKRFTKEVVANEVKIRELVTAEQGMPDFASHYHKPLQAVRLLSPEVKLATDTLLYQNKMVSIAYTPMLHAIVTEGTDIVSTQKALFEYMWRAARSTADKSL